MMTLLTATMIATAALAAAAPAPVLPVQTEPTIEEVRAATERFRDVKAALAEGYLPDPANRCETAAAMGLPKELGGMGIHYFRPDLLGIDGPPNPKVNGTGVHTDFRTPAILIYEPRADGSLELVAVENLVFEKAWKAAGNAAPPSFHGSQYERMADDPATAMDEAHHFEPHYDKHVWLYRTNPKGMYTPFNPAVTCEHAKGSGAPHAAH